MTLPILYSYRRCPYAMRARMALKSAGIGADIVEISLRNKPEALLQLSPKGTVPVLQLPNGDVLEQSLDIMRWALAQHDPQGWLNSDPLQTDWLVQQNDDQFKRLLDRYKYPERYPEASQQEYRLQAELILSDLEKRLTQYGFLVQNSPSLADVAIFPFIRQFCAVDEVWFMQSPYQALRSWLSYWLENPDFQYVMQKGLDRL